VSRNKEHLRLSPKYLGICAELLSGPGFDRAFARNLARNPAMNLAMNCESAAVEPKVMALFQFLRKYRASPLISFVKISTLCGKLVGAMRKSRKVF
jgi:hypothetical protein